MNRGTNVFASRPAEQSLGELAVLINYEHQAVQQGLEAALGRARAAGEMLLKAKARLGHGQWLPWLRANVSFGERAAQNYMRLAREWEALRANPHGGTDLTYSGALRVLTDRAEEARRLPPGGKPYLPPEVPDFLTPLAEAGLLKQDHLDLLLGLRDFYGPSLQASLVVHNDDPPLNDSREADDLINNLRVEDMPIGCWACRRPYSGEVPYPVIEACRLLERRITAGSIPQWEVAALWWACQAAMSDRAKVLLALMMGRWLERMRSYLAFWVVTGWKGEPSAEEGRDAVLAWWEFRSDLCHAGLLGAAGRLAAGEVEGLDELNSALLTGLKESQSQQSWICPTSEIYRRMEADSTFNHSLFAREVRAGG